MLDRDDYCYKNGPCSYLLLCMYGVDLLLLKSIAFYFYFVFVFILLYEIDEINDVMIEIL